MRNTYIDAYIIGDKLQSIWGDHNIHTFLECNDLPHITIEKSDGKNHIMRFHNEHFKNFVNDIVDFDKYNLPHITEICNNSSCKYHHENNIKPYNIFQIPSLRSDDKETQVKMDKLIKKIIYYMDSEIIKYNYLPNNFMFIFPILTKNFFANRLEAKIQEFWMEKFNDENYQNNVLVNNKHWGKRINKKKHINTYFYINPMKENQ